MKIILASASPRRRELLSQAGLDFEVIPSQVQEIMKGETPSEVVQSLAIQKSEDVYEKICHERGYLKNSQTQEDFLVIGADTIVVCDGRRLGKPRNEQEAFDMLKLLENRWHEVHTGIAIHIHKGGHVHREVFSQCTKVEMYPISDDEARWYIRTGEPMDKAGAYGIQGKGAVFIRGIEGDYNNVVGLPVAKVWHIIKQCEDV